MNNTRLVPSGSNSFLIRIDDTSHGDIKGVVDGASLKNPLEFSSFMNLVFKLENILDEQDDFFMTEELNVFKVPDDFEPDLELEVLFRQNHSWQGKIRLLEQKKEATFRSVLELLIFFCTVYEI